MPRSFPLPADPSAPRPAAPAALPGPARRRGLLAAGTVALLLATGCAAPPSGAAHAGPGEPAGTPAAPAPGAGSAGTPSPTAEATAEAAAVRGAVEVLPGDGALEHNPVEPVLVHAGPEPLTGVVLRPAAGGAPVAGELAEGGSRWTSTEDLAFDTAYVLEWSTGTGGGTSTFSTVSAAHEVDVRLNVAEGQVYGTGQVLELRFSEPVVHREAVERAVVVEGGGGHAGAFRWYDERTVRYRPAERWDPHTEVRVRVELLGLDVGHGMIGNADVHRSFTVGAEHYAQVDNRTKTLTAWVDGEVVGTFPVTLGNPDWPSTTGKKVIMEQAPSYLFKASSLDLAPGDPHWYETFWASNVSRLTASGEFVHEALPSAQPVLGTANVSHGCIGMSPEGAKFVHDVFRPGDVVEVLHTGYPQADPDDGYGDWNIPFEHYADESWHGDW
ncbi:L,D-transpeptidase [Kocuria flava]|uniref:L,D-transpeptidase n=1 Tax=Kocuria flava TaxID=446860 RepID=UPI002F949AD7